MIDALNHPTLFLAQLFADYLTTEASRAAGIPQDLPVLLMDSGTTPPMPSLIVLAADEKSRGLRKNIEVTCMLLTCLQATDADAADIAAETTRQQAAQILNAIDARLQDRAAFTAYLAALPENVQEGWTFMRAPVWHGEQQPLRNKERGTIFYALTATCALWWERPAV